MSLTLPIEEMVRLRMSVRLGTDGRLTLNMQPILPSVASSSSSSGRLQSNLKLHFNGTADATGTLCLDIWAEDDVPFSSTSSVLTPSTTDPEPAQQLPMPQSDVAPGTMPFDPSTFSFGSGYGQATDLSNFSQSNLGALSGNQWFDQNIADIDMTDTLFCELASSQSNMLWPSQFDMTQRMPPYDADITGKDMSSIISPHVDDGQAIMDALFPTPPLTETSSPIPSTSTSCQSTPDTMATLPTIPEPSPDQENINHSHSDVDDSPLPASPASTLTEEQTQGSGVPGSTSRPFPCLEPGCTLRFTRKYTRKVHMETHTRAKQQRKSFVCGVAGCGECFSRKHDRLRHEVGKHGQECEWTCRQCGRFFSSQTTLERHMMDAGHRNERVQ
ncbi:uncharacterized protein STEHIDRAFT_138053 [Stereum hirsutum FP-91666 SS1]|uniref:uncharacterized protein n=1 Tax=Stereum hirsutum (strain FP-91666) TaxID=721885 RepID=UPI000440C557|nr:uncharacterized protein STEHIDRAFT_138053 [Stereum hirsutum FP-91666 SS1]EIM88902.1 hypothetical protein STEHIDRAFT_138053 [Stereum hirsutum FP-91666 SS1]